MTEDASCRVLVTNDDGFASAGIAALAAAVADVGHDVVVVCPDDDSGSGASLGRMHPDEHIDVQQVALADGELMANAVDPQHWDTAAEVAGHAPVWWIDQPARTVVNLNVPHRTPDDARGMRVAELAPFGFVRAAIIENEEGRLQMELRETTNVLPSASDTALAAEGYAAINTIQGVRVADQEALREWVGDWRGQGEGGS